MDNNPFLVNRRDMNSRNNRRPRTPCNIFLVNQPTNNLPSRSNLFMFFSHWFNDCFQWVLTHCEPLRHLHCYAIDSPDTDATPQSLAQFSETRNWLKAPIRYICFHPHSRNLQMALLTSENAVMLYHENSTSPTRLEDPEQTHISCAAFRPWTPSELAVGCAAGICLWRGTRRLDVDQKVRHMLGTHRLEVLRDAEHTYITSVEWNGDGTTLASAALGTRHIVLWEPERGQRLRLLSVPDSTCSFRLLRYRPDFQLLFCARSDAGASVWHIRLTHWKQEQVLLQRRVQSAAWTSSGSHLLFVLENSSRFYASTPDAEAALFLEPQPMWGVQLVADLGRVTCYGQRRPCGEPQAIAIDPLDIYVAIIFKKQPFVLLCLLSPSTKSAVRLLPVDYINCDASVEAPAEGADIYPTCMSFSSKRGSNSDSRLLAIAWSTGYVQRQVFTATSVEEAQNLMDVKWSQLLLTGIMEGLSERLG